MSLRRVEAEIADARVAMAARIGDFCERHARGVFDARLAGNRHSDGMRWPSDDRWRTLAAVRVFDPITVVERAYALESDDRTWLADLTESLEPALGREFGTSGALWRLTGDGVEGVLDVSTRPEIAPLAPVVYGIVGSAAGRFYRHVPYFGAASELRDDAVVEQIVQSCSRVLGRQLRDVAGVCVGDGARGVALTAWSSGRARYSQQQRRRLIRLALHVGAGLRLRTRIARSQSVVLDGRGRMLHFDGDAPNRNLRRALTDAVRAVDRARGALRRRAPDEALALWPALVAGRWTIVDWVDSDARRLLVAYANPMCMGGPRALTPRERDVAEFLVHGRSNTEIAYALGLSVGTVATTVRCVLRKLGRARRSDLASTFGGELRVAPVLDDAGVVLAEGAARNPAIWARLSLAEKDIAERAIRGESNRQMARARGRSTRTIANQLHTIYARLGVRGRTELAALLGSARPTSSAG